MRKDPNLWMVERIAAALGPLREEVVFLGGAATGLLLTDPAAPSIRITRDVDVIVEVASRGGYHHLERDLQRQGFKLDCREGAPVCRWCLDDLVLDVMPTQPEILGFSNLWYPEALHTSRPFSLPSGTVIRLVAPPYFVATKLEAFFGRGAGDYLASHDLEDLVAVLDGRPGLLDEIQNTGPELRSYLKDKLSGLLADPQFLYALQGHLPGDRGSQARIPQLLNVLRILAGA